MTPQEKAEKLKQLQALQAQLEQLKALKAQRAAANQGGTSTLTPTSNAPQNGSESLPISAAGVGRATEAAALGLQDALTAGLAPKISAGLGAGVNKLLGMSGDLFVPEGGENPYADKSFSELYQEELPRFQQVNRQAEQDAPLAYTGAQLLGLAAVPAKGAIQNAALAAAQESGHGGDLSDSLQAAAMGGALTKGFEAVGSGVNALKNSKYADAFRRGNEVQKYTDPEQSTELARKVSQAIKERVGGARQAHATARRQFIDDAGKTMVDASDVAQRTAQDAARFGKDAVTETGERFGGLTDKEVADLQRYTDALSTPKTAQELYKIWDDIGNRVEYYTGLKSKGSEINRLLQGLQSGIKEKLHSISPDLKLADEAMSQVSKQSQQVAQGASNPESFLSTLGNRNRGLRREAFQELLGDNKALQREIQDFDTFKAFEGQAGFGSDYGIRNLAGAALGGAAGGAASDSSTGAGIGAAAGAALASPRTARKALTAMGDKLQPIIDMIPSLPSKFKGLLQDAMRRGGNALATTHFMLSQADPEYNALMTKKEDD